MPLLIPKPYSKNPNRARGRKYDNLYPKERLFLKSLTEGRNITESAKLAYHTSSDNSAAVIGSKVLRRRRFLIALERSGLTADYLVQKIKEGLNANKPVVTREGIELYPDQAARLGFLRTTLKIQHILTDEEDKSDTNQEPLIISAVKITQNNLTIKGNNERDT